eukprot:s1524_g4.t1
MINQLDFATICYHIFSGMNRATLDLEVVVKHVLKSSERSGDVWSKPGKLAIDLVLKAPKAPGRGLEFPFATTTVLWRYIGFLLTLNWCLFDPQDPTDNITPNCGIGSRPKLTGLGVVFSVPQQLLDHWTLHWRFDFPHQLVEQKVVAQQLLFPLRISTFDLASGCTDNFSDFAQHFDILTACVTPHCGLGIRHQLTGPGVSLRSIQTLWSLTEFFSCLQELTSPWFSPLPLWRSIKITILAPFACLIDQRPLSENLVRGVGSPILSSRAVILTDSPHPLTFSSALTVLGLGSPPQLTGPDILALQRNATASGPSGQLIATVLRSTGLLLLLYFNLQILTCTHRQREDTIDSAPSSPAGTTFCP